MLVVSSLHCIPISLTVPAFTVADGECLPLLGASGVGKSILLRSIADLELNQGEMRTGTLIRSQIPAPEWREKVIYVPAESGWWEEKVSAHFHDCKQAQTQLESVRLPADCLHWSVSRLSSGERQRLALLRALLLKPEVLLLDEPTAALDQKSVTAVETLLQAELNRGVSMVLVSHDDAQARRLAGQSRHLSIAARQVQEQP